MNGRTAFYSILKHAGGSLGFTADSEERDPGFEVTDVFLSITLLTWSCINEIKGLTTRTIACSNVSCLNTSGRIVKHKDFPLPVGRQTKTSRPFTTLVMTVFCWWRSAGYPSFKTVLDMAVSIAVSECILYRTSEAIAKCYTARYIFSFQPGTNV